MPTPVSELRERCPRDPRGAHLTVPALGSEADRIVKKIDDDLFEPRPITLDDSLLAPTGQSQCRDPPP